VSNDKELLSTSTQATKDILCENNAVSRNDEDYIAIIVFFIMFINLVQYIHEKILILYYSSDISTNNEIVTNSNISFITNSALQTTDENLYTHGKF